MTTSCPGARSRSATIWPGLDNVNANLLAIAGSEDTLVTPAAARRVMDLVRSTDKTFQVVPGGHMGILAGRKAPQASWLALADWLAARSD